MSTFISSVLSRLNNPGLSPRAEAIFTQAMTKGHYRWGRKARLTAGASIAITLREAHKSDSLRDIAFLLDDSTVSLARTFQSVVSLLDLSLASTDPAVHLPILHAHLHSTLHPETLSPPPQLPKALVSILSPLSLQAAVCTATSLSQIISHHSPPLTLTNLPTPPTACALLILGLEAEARAPLPHLGELTRTLGTRFALSSGVVSSRYKIIYDLIEEWIRHVPWLDQFVYKGKGRGAVARSKVPKRAIVAKGIKDVVQFHEEIWRSRTQNQQKVNVDLEPGPVGFANNDEEDKGNYDSVNMVAVASSSRSIDLSAIAPPPGKRRKIEKKGNAMQAARRLLLDPLSSRYSDATTSNGEMSLLTHILTCPLDELTRTPPTRLQLLAASRGGSTEEFVFDEELFAVGELEGLLRNEQEREALRPLFQLNWGEEISKEEAAVCHRQPLATEIKRGAKRINLHVLTRVLGRDVDGGSSDEDVGCLDPDDDTYLSDWDNYTHHTEHQAATEDVERVSDWRPASADGGGLGELRDTTGARYEEEL